MADNIYKNQSSLRFTLTTNVDITGATVREIKYIKPDGSTGHWDADAETLATGVIHYDLIGTELDQLGSWTIWASITFADGRTAPGKPFRIMVKEEGT